MRKYFVAAFALASLAVPTAASGHDVQDGQDCRNSTAPSITPLGTAGGVPSTEPDRGHVCVKGPAGPVIFYIGGELRPEKPESAGTGGACGAVIVGGTTVSGTDDWSNADPDGNPDTNDGRHCD